VSQAEIELTKRIADLEAPLSDITIERDVAIEMLSNAQVEFDVAVAKLAEGA
jgi:hypothetical protein